MRHLKLTVVIVLVFIIGCAGLQIESQEEAYYKALGTWYDAGIQFKFYYERADEATKEKWDNEFRPILIKAKEVLNLWSFRMQNNQSTGNEVQQWKELSNELIYYIAVQMKKEGA